MKVIRFRLASSPFLLTTLLTGINTEFGILRIRPFLDLILICRSFRCLSPCQPFGSQLVSARQSRAFAAALFFLIAASQTVASGETAANTTSAMRAFNTPAIGSSSAPDCTRHHIFTATYAGPEFFDNVLYIHTEFMKIDGVPYDCLYD